MNSIFCEMQEKGMFRSGISSTKQYIDYYFLKIVYWSFLMLKFLRNIRKSDRILIVHTRGIGDFVLLTAVLKQIRKIFEKRSIAVVIRSETKPLAEICPYIDDVITVNYEKYQYNILYRLQVLYGLLKGSYAVGYNLVYSDDDFAHQLTILSFAKRRYGVYKSDIEKIRYEKYYSRLFRLDNDVSEIYKNALFFRKVGRNIQNTSTTEIWFKKEDEIRFQQVKNKYNLKDYVVLSPGARDSIRLWENKKWISLVNRLFKITDAQILFCGRDKDEIIIKEIIKKLDFSRKIINLVNRTDLRLLAKVIEKASLFIGMESAAIHIAAAVGTPNVCLMGGGHFERFYPYGDLERNRIVCYKMDCFDCNWRCKYQYNDVLSKIKRKLPFLQDQNLDLGRCVKNIEVHDVLKEVEFLLKNVNDKVNRYIKK